MKTTFLALTLISLSPSSFSQKIDCQGVNQEGHNTSITINEPKSRLEINYRCFETGDIWQDCDSITGVFQQKEDSIKLGPWNLKLDLQLNSAELFYDGELWSKLVCSKRLSE